MDAIETRPPLVLSVSLFEIVRYDINRKVRYWNLVRLDQLYYAAFSCRRILHYPLPGSDSFATIAG